MTAMVGKLGDLDLGSVEEAALLSDIGYLYSMGHNVDLKTAKRAKDAFERSLRLAPDDAETNYRLAMLFAATRAHHFEAIPYLEKALALGEGDAKYTLGLLFVESGEREKGLALLRSYAAEHPEAEHPRKMIEGIEEGRVKFRSE